MKQVEITFKESELSIDGQSLPGGDYHVREYEDGVLIGGCYATKLNLIENLELFFEEAVAYYQKYVESVSGKMIGTLEEKMEEMVWIKKLEIIEDNT